MEGLTACGRIQRQQRRGVPFVKAPVSMFMHNIDDDTAPASGTEVYHAKLKSVGALRRLFF